MPDTPENPDDPKDPIDLSAAAKKLPPQKAPSTSSLFRLLVILAVVACAVFWIHQKLHSVAEARAFEDAVYSNADEVWTTTHTTQLAAMSAGSSTSTTTSGGSFVGTFIVRTSEDQTLRYVERRSDGGYVMDSIPAQDAVIYEIDKHSTDKPRIETQTCHVVSANPKYQAWIDEKPEERSECRNTASNSIFNLKADRHRVYVPAGTVVDTFSVDTKD